jgi:hypothetical protein
MRCHIAILAVLLLGAPGIARAAAIHIDDTKTDDTITILVNDFEGGFSVNGVLIQQGLNNPGTATIHEPDPLNFQGRWIDLGQSVPGDRIIYLIETPVIAGGPPPAVSDILRYSVDRDPANGFAVITGSFISDFENNLGTLPPGTSPNNVFLETGQAVPFAEAFLGGEILSDAEVPEPATFSILGVGLLGLGCLRRQRQRA